MNNKSLPLSCTISRSFDRTYIACVLIISLGLFAYVNAFKTEFVFDDQSSIVENHVIRNLGNFVVDSTGYDYNPRRYVVYLTFALNYHVHGLAVAGYHAINILIHVANAILIYFFVRIIYRAPSVSDSSGRSSSSVVALLTALFFVVHPVQTQAVTYVVQRTTSLMTTFCLSSILLYAKWKSSDEYRARAGHGRGPIYYFVLALVSAVLAMRTKENALTLPIVIMLYDLMFWRFDVRQRPICLVAILLTVLIIPFSMLDFHKPAWDILNDAVKATSHNPTTSRWEYLMTQFGVITTYLRLLFLPINQNLDYDYPVSGSLLNPRTAFSLLFLISIVLSALVFYRRSRQGGDGRLLIVSFGAIWYFLSLAVDSSVLPITDVIFEHRIYLASVGVFLSVITGTFIIVDHYGTPRIYKTTLVIFLMIIVSLSLATINRNRVWRDGVTLWTDVVSKSPRKVRGYNNLGAALSDAGRSKEAMAVLHTAVMIRPDHPEAYYNLGRAYLIDNNRNNDAINMFSKAIALNPEFDDASVNLAGAYLQAGRYCEAIDLLIRVVKKLPSRPDAHFNLGIAYAGIGNIPEAMTEIQILETQDPSMAEELRKFVGSRSYPQRGRTD